MSPPHKHVSVCVLGARTVGRQFCQLPHGVPPTEGTVRESTRRTSSLPGTWPSVPLDRGGLSGTTIGRAHTGASGQSRNVGLRAPAAATPPGEEWVWGDGQSFRNKHAAQIICSRFPVLPYRVGLVPGRRGIGVVRADGLLRWQTCPLNVALPQALVGLGVGRVAPYSGPGVWLAVLSSVGSILGGGPPAFPRGCRHSSARR